MEISVQHGPKDLGFKNVNTMTFAEIDEKTVLLTRSR